MEKNAASLKWSLIEHCLKLAKEKVRLLEEELASAQESIASEGKSTAGDKHETGRAMLHLEQENLQKQLAKAQQVASELERIDVSLKSVRIGLGSLVGTNKGVFFLAAALSKVELEETLYFVVSTKAPIAAQIMGKTVGDKISMNNVEYEICSVE